VRRAGDRRATRRVGVPAPFALTQRASPESVTHNRVAYSGQSQLKIDFLPKARSLAQPNEVGRAHGEAGHRADSARLAVLRDDM